MKIAFDNTLPAKDQVAALIEASGLEGHWDVNRFFDVGRERCRFVSAYDRDELVGLGRFVEGGASGEEIDGRLDIVVLPDYRSRDIVGTIFKLLKSRKAAHPAHA
ncbi:hypothetical protein [Paenibacillus flagellatus]|uniref:N-acetyltransferase domain-containing protein n=1 Tax=Paenibacillus flagellatus TaxID=2211139 RepID=A0A2V5KY36_9BACL|nr:hypothetical protein [Paenibacillus flagellatus]PYI57517.1 hypothetical protein DLM86_03550 [Paenibacillus flagellatus]